MKDSKYCRMTACCWSYRHELVGLVLLVIAAFLTIITCNSFGIAAMFLVGMVLCAHRHLFCHCHDHCHGHEGHHSCCSMEENDPMPHLDMKEKQPAKKTTKKTKTS